MLLSGICANLNGLSARTKSWDYPVKPGTPQWEALKTRNEMLKAVQIPESVLKSVSTEELVEICLDYPLMVDLWVYNSLQEGLRRNVAVNFNGVQELFRRTDNVQPLLELLKNNDLMKLSPKEFSTLELGRSAMKQAFVEVLLSHESVLANANPEQQKEIARISIRNMVIKESQPNVYSQSSVEAAAYLSCASMTKMNGGAALSPELDKFLESGSAADMALISEELTNSFIKF